MARATLAIMKVGKCINFLSGSPKPNAGPKWNGVKGIPLHLKLDFPFL
jgi:hypothetical protein